MCGFLRGDECAGEAAGERSAAPDFDAKSDRQVDRHVGDPRRGAEQSVERFQMVAESLPRIVEPGENSAIALVQGSARRADLETRDDLLN